MTHPVSSRRPIAALLLTLLTPTTWAATFTVDSSGDAADANPGDGLCATAGAVCTLRAAMEEANASAGADTIQFAIGSGAVTIAPMSALPALTDTVAIDGYTQGGSSANSLAVGSNAVINVSLDGTGAGAGVPGLMFSSGSGGSSVRGLQIGGFTSHGILVDGQGTSPTGYTIAGNFIGTDTAGADRHNGGAGVFLFDTVGSSTIGGATPADRNVVAANWGTGVTLGSTSSITLRNNYIGVTPSGSTPLWNQSAGVIVNSSNHTTVQGNVIGAGSGGIYAYSLDTDYTTIVANSIGVGADGTTDIAGFGHGVSVGSEVAGPPRYTTVGGTGAGAGNTIANWGGSGVMVNRANAALPFATDITILGNSIYNNGGLGIELTDTATGSGAGVTSNDPGDGDAGPNRYQNYPDPVSATTDGMTTTVQYTLSAGSFYDFRVEFFSSPACHASGHGEGRVFLGSQAITTDGSGAASSSVTLPATTVGHVVTLTATDTFLSDTSEFSACVTVTAAPPPATITAAASPAAAGSVVCAPNPVNAGASSSCTITTNAGYQLTGVGGSCGGTLNGNTYTTAAVNTDCTVTAQYAVQMTVAVSGQGTVTSAPSGIACGATCSAWFDGALSVALTPAPAAGHAFTGWSGDCTGSGACAPAMDAPRSVTASFAPLPATYTITTGVAPAGSGSVVCTPNPVMAGTVSSCVVTANAGYQPASVGGSCGGTLSGNGYTTAAINGDCSVIAQFTEAAAVPALAPWALWGLPALLAAAGVGGMRRRQG